MKFLDDVCESKQVEGIRHKFIVNNANMPIVAHSISIV